MPIDSFACTQILLSLFFYANSWQDLRRGLLVFGLLPLPLMSLEKYPRGGGMPFFIIQDKLFAVTLRHLDISVYLLGAVYTYEAFTSFDKRPG